MRAGPNCRPGTPSRARVRSISVRWGGNAPRMFWGARLRSTTSNAMRIKPCAARRAGTGTAGSELRPGSRVARPVRPEGDSSRRGPGAGSVEGRGRTPWSSSSVVDRWRFTRGGGRGVRVMWICSVLW